MRKLSTSVVVYFKKPRTLFLACLFLLSLGALLLDHHYTVKRGLTGKYYANLNWKGEPLFTVLDPEISTAQLSRRRKRLSINRFSIDWSGFMLIEKPGKYTFATGSDDGSWFYVNHQLVVNNGGVHGLRRAKGQIFLKKGIYPVRVLYFQIDGQSRMDLYWASEGRSLSRFPSSILFPQPVHPRSLSIHRNLSRFLFFLQILWLGILLYLLLSCIQWLFSKRSPLDFLQALPAYPTRRKRTHFTQALVFFLLLSIVHTWPLATNPCHLSRNNNADTELCEWIISWIAYRLPRDPLHLFDANIFHPERSTLTLSEPLLVPGIIGAPLRWMGASPVLTFNLLLLLGFTLTGLAMHTLIRAFTGDHLAGLMAGSLLAFNAQTLTRIPHLQAQYAIWLPLALLALDRLLNRKQIKDALWLAFFLTLLTITSGYLGIMAAIAVGVGVIMRMDDWWKRRTLPFLLKIGLAGIITCVFTLVLLAPYWYTYRAYGMARSLDLVEELSALPAYYLTTGGRLHYSLWSHRFYRYGGDSLFPGLVATALAATAITFVLLGMKSNRLAKRRVRMLTGIGVAGVLLSFGPSTPLYTWLYHIFPPLQAVRAASRFGYLLLMSAAALAGYGLSVIRLRYSGRRGIVILIWALLLAANLEALRAPMQYVPYEGIPPIYQIIARDKNPSVVAEMPFYPPKTSHENASYMVASTEHWKPLINGWGGRIPKSYRRRAEVLRHFPSNSAIEELQHAGVTYVVVHLKRYSQARAEEIVSVLSHHPAFSLLASSSEQGIKLYRLNQ